MKMAQTYTRNSIYDGSDQPPGRQRILHAGPLSLVLEGGDLRYIRLGDREVLRRVYVAVRDRNWGTIPPVYENMHLDVGDDRFHIEFDAMHREDEIDFTWHGTIHGDPDGTITYAMDGAARRTFLKNRIGLCVLHPMDCADVSCTVEGADGSLRQGAFPREIAPDQPFMDFQAITHKVAPGVYAAVRLSGDIFEMEDQRNWTDASFKTYSTPLRIPYPAQVREGTVIMQSCTLALQRAERIQVLPADAPLTITLDPTIERPLPRLGLGSASHGEPLTPDEIERLRVLHLAHLRLDLDLAADLDKPLREAARQAGALGIPLEIALFLSDHAGAELPVLAESLRRVQPDVVRWLVFHKGDQATRIEWVRLAREILSAVTPGAAFGGGSDAHFAELNRNRPPREGFDVVSFAVTPQAHAFDNASLVESLSAQAVTLDSAREFSGAMPVVVSPITLRPRFNANATVPGVLPPQVDRRQMSLFGAAWTTGSIKYLTAGGAESVTYYETTGPRGVMETARGSALPEQFRSTPGMVYPLYHVLADVGDFAGDTVLSCRSSDPLRVDCLALRDNSRTRLLVANMQGTPSSVRVQGLGRHAARLRYLDEESFERATLHCADFRREPGEPLQIQDEAIELTLRPYAMARIDLDGSA
jgi:hypothetical protein